MKTTKAAFRKHPMVDITCVNMVGLHVCVYVYMFFVFSIYNYYLCIMIYTSWLCDFLFFLMSTHKYVCITMDNDLMFHRNTVDTP